MKAGCESLLRKSNENFGLALELKERGMLNAAANRFYYSVFQAVKAYAVAKDKMKMGDDKGVHAQASSVVRETERQYHRTIREACDMRVKADYLEEDISTSELDAHFVSELQSMRDRFESLAKSA